jgi:CTP synthase
MSVIEFAKNVLKLEDVNSEEFDENCKNPLIHIMEDQVGIESKGGTMRLGAYPCTVKEGTLAHKLYEATEISERHRHRYEFNNKYREALEEKGLIISGTSPDVSINTGLTRVPLLSEAVKPFILTFTDAFASICNSAASIVFIDAL